MSGRTARWMTRSSGPSPDGGSLVPVPPPETRRETGTADRVRVVGLDPGSRVSGWGAVEEQAGNWRSSSTGPSAARREIRWCGGSLVCTGTSAA